MNHVKSLNSLTAVIAIGIVACAACAACAAAPRMQPAPVSAAAPAAGDVAQAERLLRDKIASAPDEAKRLSAEYELAGLPAQRGDFAAAAHALASLVGRADALPTG